MKALSLDLRQRIVDAYKQRQGSQRQLALRFSVSRSSVERLLKRARETGSLAPKPHGGGRPPRLQEHDRQTIQQWLDEHPDLIQQELAERIRAKTGGTVSQQTISRTLSRLAITRKKSP
jgi:transposase